MCCEFPHCIDCREMIRAQRMKQNGQEELVGGGGWLEVLDGQLGQAFWGGDIRVRTDPKDAKGQPCG